jgi:hypothetical protein
MQSNGMNERDVEIIKESIHSNDLLMAELKKNY